MHHLCMRCGSPLPSHTDVRWKCSTATLTRRITSRMHAFLAVFFFFLYSSFKPQSSMWEHLILAQSSQANPSQGGRVSKLLPFKPTVPRPWYQMDRLHLVFILLLFRCSVSFPFSLDEDKRLTQLGNVLPAEFSLFYSHFWSDLLKGLFTRSIGYIFTPYMACNFCSCLSFSLCRCTITNKS